MGAFKVLKFVVVVVVGHGAEANYHLEVPPLGSSGSLYLLPNSTY